MTSAYPTVLLCRQPALLGAAFFALAGIWWAFAARISARLDAHTLTLAAPLWWRRLPREQISQVRVEPDSGLNPGLLNWPQLARQLAEALRG